ncbi:MAG TPA: Na/Pi cotransporter family protein [Aestuariivirgaceae bacterium]|jgi:phosphate:Na+ symporter
MNPLSPGSLVIVNLLGGVALLLWGVRMVRTGILRAWGERLKRFIETRLKNRFTAFLAGLGATILLQSGTATALIITGLAAAGGIAAARGLAVLLGSDVGSAIVSAVFATGGAFLSLWLSPLLVFAGYALFTISSDFKPRNMGRIFMGLGLMLLALKLVTSATSPLREATLFHNVLANVGAEHLLAFLIGAIVTWLSYSSLAIMLLVATFVANGSLEVAGALAFVLGINLGAGLPALLSTAEYAPAARRLPLANLLCRGTAAALTLALLPQLAPLVLEIPGNPVHRVLAAHLGFNIAVAVVFLPFCGPVMKLVKKILPDRQEADDPLMKTRYLDRHAFDSPSVALSNASLETVRMAELLDRMLRTAVEALKSSKAENLKAIRLLDERLNRHQREIQAYVAELTRNELSAEESKRALEIMLYVSNLEHAGDIIHLSLADRIKAKIKENVTFTPTENEALNKLIEIVLDSLRIASGVLGAGDIAGARRLIQQKDVFRSIENRIISEKFRDGSAKEGSLRQGALYVDLIRDLHAINSHIVSAGYPIVDAAGLLRDSRLKAAEKSS